MALTTYDNELVNDSDPLDLTQGQQQTKPLAEGEYVPAKRLERIGRYRIEKVLGQGGFGIVYLAHDEQLDRLVAIKVPHANLICKPEDAEAYLAEARTVASLDHPQIVPVFDVGSIEDCPCYFVSKYIEGSVLAKRIKEQRFRYRDAAELVATVANALHYAHKQGLVHRDVKPGNILIDREGRPFVVDFGLALREENVGKGPKYAGTPSYMSPEQARGEGHRVDGRSDIFSLGVVFYELLVGRRPFRGDTQAELFEQVTSFEPKPLRQYDDRIPKELERICFKAMAKRASERYSTAKDFADDLRLFLQEQTLLQIGMTPGGVTSQALQTLAVQGDSTAVNSGTVRSGSSSDNHPIKIMPKGLRSFDAQDADFFLELLPGPRDRNGLPDSLRFWKSRIEELDPGSTFSVGLIYGPSGCGKSSLVKAGLLPRLSEDVIPVYIEATPDDTEARLTHGLRKHCPALEDNLSLKDTLATLRRGQGIPVSKKVLIVLDQFEQWLHAHKEEENADLVQALRQCDGGRVQCIVMVRDDFWLAVSRFLRDLEVRLLEGHNSALVDLFDLDHSRKVLAAFGRAFGKLPEIPGDTNKEQREFLKQAVSELAEEGKVICVRLALFAEMMKGKSWTPATLKKVGGTKGVGLTFLEETFSAATAPPEHRYHQKAARAVLEALLPDSGTDIKGQMKSHGQLLEASGYGQHGDFDAMLGILDSQVRLITPTEPDESIYRDDRDATSQHSRYYQLTHDFLVPSIRQWLTQKQQETRRGRAELRLAERSALWNAKPENRYLPSLAEWVRIRTLTDKSKWTTQQRKMMKRAGQMLGLWSAFAVSFAMALIIAGVAIRGRIVEASNEQRATGFVTALVNAEVAQVPGILSELENYRSWADPRLKTELVQYAENSRSRLNVSLGLLPSDPSQLGFLQQRLLNAEPRDVETIAKLLANHKDQLLGELWSVLDSPGPERAGQVLHAASALAIYDPESNEKWNAAAPRITDRLVNENPLRLAVWIDQLRPLRKYLVPPLADVFRAKPDDRLQSEIDLATDILEDYAADDLEQLSELVLDASPKQFAALFDELTMHGDAAISKLDREINRVLTPQWNDGSLDPAWAKPGDDLVQRLGQVDGMVAERFAFCQTLPLDEFQGIADELAKSGYRPLRLRPYAHDNTALVAATWSRDGRDWRAEIAESAESMLVKDEAQRNDGFVAVDVAGYLGDQTGRAAELYAGVWVKQQSDREDARVYVGVPIGQHRNALEELRSQGYAYQHSLQAFCDLDSEWKYCAVKTKGVGNGAWPWRLTPSELDSRLYLDKIHWDIDPIPAANPKTTRQRYEKALADAEANLQDSNEDPNARFARGVAHFHLENDEAALRDMDFLIETAPNNRDAYLYRAILHARNERPEQAHEDSIKYCKLSSRDMFKLYLDVIISSYADDNKESIERLEAFIGENHGSGEQLYNAACMFSLAVKATADRSASKSSQYAARAVELIQQAIDAGYNNYSLMQQDADLDPIRNLERFQEILARLDSYLRYTAVWNEVPGFESRELHGLALNEHVTQCQRLQDEGYRPVSVSATSIDGEVATASVWHRPLVPRAHRERLARRQANAAAAMAKLAQHDKLFPALRVTDDPESLTQFVHRCRAEGVTPPQLLACLQSADRNRKTLRGDDRRLEDCVVFGLLLALGEFSLDELPGDQQQATVDQIARWYSDDPSSSIHGAAGWLLRAWGQDDRVRQVDEAPRSYDPAREWFTLAIKADQQTFYQTYVVIMPGDYTIGSPSDDPVRESSEPLNRVRLTRPVAILDREITRGEYEAFGQRINGVERYSPTLDHPMIQLSWYDSVQFCRALTRQSGLSEADQSYPDPAELNVSQFPREGETDLPKNWPVRLDASGFRLPTEAEWEIAARASMRTVYSFGSDESLLDHYAWYQDNSRRRTHVPKQLRPNLRGLFDMHGNVYEWCHDWYDGYPLGSLRRDPVGPSSGSIRVFRGGGWEFIALRCRSAIRDAFEPSHRAGDRGFRVAVVPSSQASVTTQGRTESGSGQSVRVEAEPELVD